MLVRLLCNKLNTLTIYHVHIEKCACVCVLCARARVSLYAHTVHTVSQLCHSNLVAKTKFKYPKCVSSDF